MSFTIAELREILRLPKIGFTTDKTVICEELKLHEEIWKTQRPQKRLFQLLIEDGLESRASRNGKTLSIRYLRSPVKVCGFNSVSGLILERMKFASCDISHWSSLINQKVVGTNEFEEKEYQLIVSCIGFENPYTFDLPVTGKFNTILNTNGRVSCIENLYTCGWVATGPDGDLASTIRHVYLVADTILHDISNLSTPHAGATQSNDKFRQLLKSRRINYSIYNPET